MNQTTDPFETLCVAVVALAFGLAFGLTLDNAVGAVGWGCAALGALGNGSAAAVLVSLPVGIGFWVGAFMD